MSIEDMIIRKMEREDKEAKKRFVKKDIGNRATDMTVNDELRRLKARGWESVWDEKKLSDVARYNVRNNRRFENENGENEPKNAEVLEQLFLFGVNQMNWFANTLPPDPNTGKRLSSFACECHPSERYDDIRHRIDSYVCLKYPDGNKSIQTSYPNLKNNSLVFGVDVTTWQSDDARESNDYFIEKISRSNNEPINNPFGASQIDFYTNWREKTQGNLGIVPRFVVGINGRDADYIRRFLITEGQDGRLNVKNYEIQKDPRAQLAKFKTLWEINLQASTFLQFIPEASDDHPEIKEYEESLRLIKVTMKRGLNKNIDDIIETLSNKKMLDERFLKSLEGASPDQKNILLYKEILRKNSPLYDSVFAGIDNSVKLFQNSTPSATSRIKTIQPRNKVCRP